MPRAAISSSQRRQLGRRAHRRRQYPCLWHAARRALAGAAGDAEARIFVNRLEAELLSIAGRYLVRDRIEPEHIGQAVQVALRNDRLAITPA